MCYDNGDSLFISGARRTNLSFYFYVLESMQNIHLAQQARLGYHSPMQWLRSVSMLIVALFVEMFQRSRELNNAMQSRGGDAVYWQEMGSYSKKIG